MSNMADPRLGDPIYVVDRQEPKISLWGRTLTIAEAERVLWMLAEVIKKAKAL